MIDIDLHFEDGVFKKLYAFDRHNPNHSTSKEVNHFFLRACENMANDMLRARGHVFVNDILDSLGMPRTPEGAVLGWALGFNGPVRIQFELDDDDLHQITYIRLNPQGPIIDKLESSHDLSIAHFGVHREPDE